MDFALAKIELYHRDLVALTSELPPIATPLLYALGPAFHYCRNNFRTHHGRRPTAECDPNPVISLTCRLRRELRHSALCMRFPWE
jgi:hypothetical protein